MQTNNIIKHYTKSTLIIGIDVAKYNSVARAFNSEGKELSKAITFTTDYEGLNLFHMWINKIKSTYKLKDSIIGMEPTGHYWIRIEDYIVDKISNSMAVLVEASDVKSMRDLLGMENKKTDHIDAMAIAKTILFGKYSTINKRNSGFTDLKELIRFREEKIKEKVRLDNKIQRWLDINFPEYKLLFKKWNTKTSIAILKNFPTQREILNTNSKKIVSTIKEEVKTGNISKYVELLKEIAEKSIALDKCSEMQKIILKHYLENYLNINQMLVLIENEVNKLLKKIDYAQNLVEIKGVSSMFIGSILAETGDLKNFKVPQQLLAYAGLDLKISESGEKKGKTTISKRGNSRVRAILFKYLLPFINANEEFKALHKHYTTRSNNQLKGMQSLIAVGCKLLRVFFGMSKTNTNYEPTIILEYNQFLSIAA
ncbi:IS110 family transposase [Clostridium beijerinckii]|uniref:IS110 family transposase n=1 Tax=Clostridium beijerinckii TaxID=1520 RepID=UPI00080A27B6|nr:IS110 family transposase [Clostridium beijerinckii]OCA99358.1 hypothetical protein BGS1_08935 [Clostridium beijerinckii]